MEEEVQKNSGGFFETDTLKMFFREALETIVTALILTFVIYYFISTPNQVQGNSMLPNIHPDELILTNRVEHHLSKTGMDGKIGIGYERGDVVIFKQPGKEAYIKRIVGLPNDEIAICENNLIINNKVVKENYLPTETITFPSDFLKECEIQKIPGGSYATFGDNRTHSLDSRSEAVGFVREQYFIGAAYLRLLPFNKIGLVGVGQYSESEIDPDSELSIKLHYK